MSSLFGSINIVGKIGDEDQGRWSRKADVLGGEGMTTREGDGVMKRSGFNIPRCAEGTGI